MGFLLKSPQLLPRGNLKTAAAVQYGVCIPAKPCPVYLSPSGIVLIGQVYQPASKRQGARWCLVAAPALNLW